VVSPAGCRDFNGFSCERGECDGKGVGMLPKNPVANHVGKATVKKGKKGNWGLKYLDYAYITGYGALRSRRLENIDELEVVISREIKNTYGPGIESTLKTGGRKVPGSNWQNTPRRLN